jgi:predicted HAD superfamily Cof-like phosphohydrolase
MNYEELVLEFHETYGLDIGEEPGFPDDIVRGMRRHLIIEELAEYLQAELDEDLVAVADALADLVYVSIGAAITYGIPFDEIFHEIQRSNMSKLDENGNPIYREDGKVLKGPNFAEPDIEGILKGRTLVEDEN